MNKKLGQFLTSSSSAIVAMALITVASPAQAGDVLFVSDTLTDANNIPAVLSGGSAEVPHATIAGAGFRPAMNAAVDHNVTIIRNDYMNTGGVIFAAEGTNPTLEGVGGATLADYCSIFWSASGPHEPDLFGGGFGADGGLHNDPDVFTGLDSLGPYVAGGGYVFVTGHDAAADPADPLLESFIGGAGAIAVQQTRNPPNSGGLGVVIAANNALATGEVDLGGDMPGSTTPGGVNTIDGVSQDLDYIAGMDVAEVTGVVNDPIGGADAFMWTERVPAANGGAAAGSDFSKGRIAYVANGVFLLEDLPFNPGIFLSHGEDESWLTDPTYNAALRNFASNGCAVVALPPDPPTDLAGRAKRNRVNLTWQASASADTYNVHRKLNSEAVFSQVGTVAGTVFVDTLPGGTTSADYYVEAENADGISGPSNTITVMPRSR